MIGATYQSRAIQAVLGPGHSIVIPDTLYSGWLDASLDLIAMSGTTVAHEQFGESGLGVANIETIDAGLAPADEPAFFALFDDAVDGEVVAYAPVTFDTPPVDGDPLAFEAGELTFTYLEL